jgi:hypothetical protein
MKIETLSLEDDNNQGGQYDSKLVIFSRVRMALVGDVYSKGMK